MASLASAERRVAARRQISSFGGESGCVVGGMRASSGPWPSARREARSAARAAALSSRIVRSGSSAAAAAAALGEAGEVFVKFLEGQSWS